MALHLVDYFRHWFMLPSVGKDGACSPMQGCFRCDHPSSAASWFLATDMQASVWLDLFDQKARLVDIKFNPPKPSSCGLYSTNITSHRWSQFDTHNMIRVAIEN